jgi:hypothetical protein
MRISDLTTSVILDQPIQTRMFLRWARFDLTCHSSVTLYIGILKPEGNDSSETIPQAAVVLPYISFPMV